MAARYGAHRFTWLMIRFILVMVPTVFLINGLTKHDWLEALLFAVAVAVGLTPEMLPMIVTVNLAKGALAMSREKVIVQRLNAIQNLGAMDVLWHGQDRHPDPGSHHLEAASRHPRRGIGTGAAVRLFEQPLSIWT
jgi:E1-E2 ATPase